MPVGIGTPQVDAVNNGDPNWGPKVKADIDALNGQFALAAVNTYRPVSASALSSLTGMRAGDLAVRTDTAVTYRYNGSTWQAWDSDWITYTGNVQGLVGSVGANPGYTFTAQYRYRSGRIIYEGFVTLTGSGAGTTSDPWVQMPVAKRNDGSHIRPIGTAVVIDASPAGTIETTPAWVSNAFYFNFATRSTSNPNIGTALSTQITLAQNDELHWVIEYDPA